jgi:hypothetical protein
MRFPVPSPGRIRLAFSLFSILLASASTARAGSRDVADESGPSTLMAAQNAPPASRPAPHPIEIELQAIADTVIAHQTAWLRVRITNNTARALRVPFRSEKIPGEWKFTDAAGNVLVDWPAEKEMEHVPFVTIGAGEVLYEVLSPESSYGVLTNSGTVYAFCRLGQTLSSAAAVSRRPATSAERSALRGLGPLHDPSARDKAQVELWSLCGRGNDYYDCDEALFTVIWDRLLVSSSEAQAVVDSLLSQSPGSGWCRPALYGLMSKLPESAGRRYLESVVARKLGGVAESYALELLRRGRYKECPTSGRNGKH